MIGVAPRYAANVVRYYLRDTPAAPAVEPFESVPPPAVAPLESRSPPAVVIVAEAYANSHAADLARRYPRLLAHPRGLVVLAKAPPRQR